MFCGVKTGRHGQINRQTDRRMDGLPEGQEMDKQTDGWTGDRRTGGWMVRPTDGQTDRWTSGWTGRQTDERTDRQRKILIIFLNNFYDCQHF